jgi:hypothetical protein
VAFNFASVAAAHELSVAVMLFTGPISLSRNDVPVARIDQKKDHSLAIFARFRVTTAVPSPVAGVGFLYVSSSPLIVMKRF